MRKFIHILLCLLPLLCQNARADDNHVAGGRLLDAVALFGKQDYEECSRILDSLNRAGVSDDAVCYYLGMSEFAKGNNATAEAMLRQAVIRDSSNIWYLSALSSVYEAREKWAELAEVCEKMMNMDPEQYCEPYFYARVGNAFSQAGNAEQAAMYLDKALELVPDMEPALFNRGGVALVQKDYEKYFSCVEILMRSTELPADWKYKYLASMTSMIHPDTLKTYKAMPLAVCAVATKSHPGDISLHVLRQQLAYYVEDWQTVLEEVDNIITLTDGDADTYESMMQIAGDVYMTMGDSRRCFDAYEKVLKVNPNNVSTLNNYAYSLSQTGKKLSKALKMSEKTIVAEPENPTYLDTYGWILHLLGKNEKAREIFKKACLYGGRQESVILRHYAEVLRALGENDLAAYYESLAEK